MQPVNATHLSLALGRATADGNGTGVDVTKLEGMGYILFNAANVSGTTPTLDGHLEDSADNSTDWTTVKGPDGANVAAVQVTTVAGVQKLPVDWNACRAYVRWVDDVAASGTPVYDRTALACAWPKSSTA